MSQGKSEMFEVHEDAYARLDVGLDAALTFNHNESAVFEVHEDAYSRADVALNHNHNEILVEA
ncbi:hypothetical protein AB0O28_34115 [Microbispora sp. NPDC088329]|uniref:hypothetical protein n=1 Tax=Microbispora sp. NPDC088329 TaxID=3154869 RepID=UPI0034156C2A